MLHESMKQTSTSVFQKKAVYIEVPPEGRKAYRADEVGKQTVTVAGLSFDADETAMDRIDRVIDLANWKFNQLTASGVSASDAYAAIYNTQVPWKTADNNLVQITVETLCQVQELAVNSLATIWVKYG
jgi:hypothetical protein